MESKSVGPSALRPEVITAPVAAAFAELTSAGLFKQPIAPGVNGANWLQASPAILAGLDDAAARLLKTKKIDTVALVARSRAAWPREGFSPQATRVLANAKQQIQAAAKKYGFAI